MIPAASLCLRTIRPEAAGCVIAGSPSVLPQCRQLVRHTSAFLSS
jgi:hypothetical protein